MTEDMIWQILDTQFCSFKTKFEKLKLCTNEYNLTGVCNKMYCPLSNGRYATIKEENGVLYLHIKTIERAHTPAELWEKIQLPEDVVGALTIINDQLAFWPKRFVNRVKERLLRLRQYLIRYRKLYYKAKPRLVTVHKKFERREQKRELKALVASKLDFAIKQELLERLKQGTYEPFINVNNPAYMEILKEEKRKDYLDRKFKKRTLGQELGKSDYQEDHEERVEKIQKEKAKAKAAANKAGLAVTQSTEFVADDVDEDDIDEEEIEDLEDFEGEEDVEQEYEMEDEEEAEDIENDTSFADSSKDAEDDAISEEILKGFPINLGVEAGDDEEMKRLKKILFLKRKRKLMQKYKEERKRAKEVQNKKKHYPHVEVEYEAEPATTTTTQTSRYQF